MESDFVRLFYIWHFIRTQAKVVWPEKGTQITGGTGLGRPAYLETKERETLYIHTLARLAQTNWMSTTVDVCIEREYIYNITLCCCYIDVSNIIWGTDEQTRWIHAVLRCARPACAEIALLVRETKGKKGSAGWTGRVGPLYIYFFSSGRCVCGVSLVSSSYRLSFYLGRPRRAALSSFLF